MSIIITIETMTGCSTPPAHPGESASREAARLWLSLNQRPVRAA